VKEGRAPRGSELLNRRLWIHENIVEICHWSTESRCWSTGTPRPEAESNLSWHLSRSILNRMPS